MLRFLSGVRGRQHHHRSRLALLRIARDHSVDLDGLTGAGIEVDDDDRRRTPEPRAQFALADEVRGPLRAVWSDHPDGLTLMKLAVADAAHRRAAGGFRLP